MSNHIFVCGYAHDQFKQSVEMEQMLKEMEKQLAAAKAAGAAGTGGDTITTEGK